MFPLPLFSYYFHLSHRCFHSAVNFSMKQLFLHKMRKFIRRISSKVVMSAFPPINTYEQKFVKAIKDDKKMSTSVGGDLLR